jgi:hypothetical protein
VRILSDSDPHLWLKFCSRFVGMHFMKHISTSSTPHIYSAKVLYYFDHLFRCRVTEGREVNEFGTCDGDFWVMKSLFFERVRRRENDV